MGRLQYISRFIIRLTDTYEPIFRLLRKKQPKVWDDQSPPILVPPMPGRPLLLYLSFLDNALGCVLAQLDDSDRGRVIGVLCDCV